MVGDILQPTHLLFVLVVALLVLGPKRLPEVGRTLGSGIRDFRAAINGESNDRREEIDSQRWHSEPEEKHEFAHDGETTPESHEFAHEAVVSTDSSEPAAPKAAAVAAPPEAAPTGPAATGHASPAPAAASDTAAVSDKHEFAHETAEPAEDPAGHRT